MQDPEQKDKYIYWICSIAERATAYSCSRHAQPTSRKRRDPVLCTAEDCRGSQPSPLCTENSTYIPVF